MTVAKETLQWGWVGVATLAKSGLGLIYPYGPSPSVSPTMKVKARQGKRSSRITKHRTTKQTARGLY